jgi:hypothetical protein
MPGVASTPFLPFLAYTACDSQSPPDIRCHWIGNQPQDAEGAGYFVKKIIALGPGVCFQNKERYEIWRTATNGASILVAAIDERCGPNPNDLHDGLGGFPAISLDPTNGYLLIQMNPACKEATCDETRYPRGYTVCRLTGFTTLFEILQTYTPLSNAFQFRVPYMPEGFQAAEHFDSYCGNLAHPIDFSQAQPMQCAYPSSPPSVGDYFTVADTSPDPAPGHGYYYVTAVTHEGQTRYGRKRINGVTSGRDPAVLPECAE